MSDLHLLPTATLLCGACGVLCLVPELRAAGGARRNRVASLALVAAFVLLGRWQWPDGALRDEVQYLLTITLGYGHLIGALWFSQSAGRPDWLARSFRVGAILSGLAVYSAVLSWHPLAFAPLLAVSVWHTAENALALDQAYANRLRTRPMPASLEHQAVALGSSCLVMVVGLASPEWRAFSVDDRIASVAATLLRGICTAAGIALLVVRTSSWRRLLGGVFVVAACVDLSPWASSIRLGDLFVVTTLYHLVSWLILFLDRIRALHSSGEADAARGAAHKLAWAHLPPALLCALIVQVGEELPGLRFAVLSPAVYLYWSVLHVAQTARARGLASA